MEDSERNQDRICESCEQFVVWGDWRVATGGAGGFVLREGQCACEARGFVQTRMVPGVEHESQAADQIARDRHAENPASSAARPGAAGSIASRWRSGAGA